MARLIGYIYRVRIPAPPGASDVLLDLTVRGLGQFLQVTEAPEQLQRLVGRSAEYALGFCEGRGWLVLAIQVWDNPTEAQRLEHVMTNPER